MYKTCLKNKCIVYVFRWLIIVWFYLFLHIMKRIYIYKELKMKNCSIKPTIGATAALQFAQRIRKAKNLVHVTIAVFWSNKNLKASKSYPKVEFLFVSFFIFINSGRNSQIHTRTFVACFLFFFMTIHFPRI